VFYIIFYISFTAIWVYIYLDVANKQATVCEHDAVNPEYANYIVFHLKSVISVSCFM
jgi:TRAP-type mannitol/chloroaromatic compound transport system permease small subunit